MPSNEKDHPEAMRERARGLLNVYTLLSVLALTGADTYSMEKCITLGINALVAIGVCYIVNKRAGVFIDKSKESND